MKFCSDCAAPLERRVPEGDDRERHVCPACAAVHYQNPKTVVGCVVEDAGELLLCRRSIEPARGRWTFPAGFQELGETAREGAIRETREEACAEVTISGPLAYLDIPHISQSYMIYRAHLDGSFSAGAESLEAHLFPADEVPWEELAFPTIRLALQLWCEDRERGCERMHFGAVRWSGDGSRYDFAGYHLDGHHALP